MEFAYLVAFIAVAIAAVSDLKTREVADWLNYSLIAFGLGINLLLSITYSNPYFISYSIAGLLLCMGLAFAFFYSGQWGGGDSKLIIGLGAVFGLVFTIEKPFIVLNQFLVSFFINLLFVGAAYGLLWSAVLAVRKREKFSKAFIAESAKSRSYKIAAAAAFAVLVILAVVINNFLARLSFIAAAIMLITTFYLYLFIKAVEKSCMLKYVSPQELTEGDWIAEELRVDGKYITGPKDLGIEKKQIKQLIELKVRKVLVKEGIPFVPSFFISFIITYLFGNLILYFFAI